MSDTTTPTGADSVERIVAEMRETADVRDLRDGAVHTEVVREWADRLAALSSPAPAQVDDEHPPRVTREMIQAQRDALDKLEAIVARREARNISAAAPSPSKEEDVSPD